MTTNPCNRFPSGSCFATADSPLSLLQMASLFLMPKSPSHQPMLLYSPPPFDMTTPTCIRSSLYTVLLELDLPEQVPSMAAPCRPLSMHNLITCSFESSQSTVQPPPLSLSIGIQHLYLDLLVHQKGTLSRRSQSCNRRGWTRVSIGGPLAPFLYAHT
ncbi:hypothetical protein GOP47_0029520 [Adiantum capillus-veneris]|nr:hypothetical protein GOP47_0029520 [Adiantum capillus-veneris]